MGMRKSTTNHRMLRLRGDRTQRQVASELGIPVSTYAMIELGQRFPRRDLQGKLARFYGTTVDDLFFSGNDECGASLNSGHSERRMTE